MIGEEHVPASNERPYFNVPLNLPHAGRIARRIVKLLLAPGPVAGAEAADARKQPAAQREHRRAVVRGVPASTRTPWS